MSLLSSRMLWFAAQLYCSYSASQGGCGDVGVGQKVEPKEEPKEAETGWWARRNADIKADVEAGDPHVPPSRQHIGETKTTNLLAKWWMVQFQVYIFLATAEGDPMTIHRGEAVLTTGNRVRLQQRHPRQPMQLLLHGPPVPVSYQPREEIDGPMSTADFNSNIIQMLILRRDEPARASPP